MIAAIDYLKQPIAADEERVQVINLCRSFKYLGLGYYVSLLSEARGHKVIPAVRTTSTKVKRRSTGRVISPTSFRTGRWSSCGG